MRELHALVIVIALSACQPSGSNEQTVTGPDLSGFPYGECPTSSNTPVALSIKTLADAPDQYEGAYVQVSGYYYSYFEHSAIYSHPERELYAQNFRTGIWLFGVDDSFSGKHVEVTGFFTHTIQGHLGQWPGSICATTVAETARTAP